MGYATDNQKPSLQKRVLNVKALVIVLTALAALHFGVGRLHSRQVSATSDYLKRTGLAALEAGERPRALELLDQYLMFRGGDVDVRRIVAELLLEHPAVEAWQRAFVMNEQMLLDAKDDDELRLRQVQVAAKLDRWSDAEAHLHSLRTRLTNRAAVWHYSGLVAEHLDHVDAAKSHFERAILLPDATPQSFEHLANLYSDKQDGRIPDLNRSAAVLDQMIATHDTPESRRIRAAWLLQQQRPEQAAVDLWQAAAVQPADIQVNTLLLQTFRQTTERDAAPRTSNIEYNRLRQHLAQQVAVSPDSAAQRLLLATALWLGSEHTAAIATLEDGIRHTPKDYRLHELLIDFLVSRSETERARRVFGKLPERALPRAHWQFMQGRLFMAEHQWQPAANAFGLAMSLAGDNEDIRSRASVSLALCQQNAGDSVAARESFRSLMQADPDSVSGRLGMATAYLQQQDAGRAIIEYRRLQHVPGVPAFLANLLIEYNLSQPEARRDWSEVETLLSDTHPAIRDDVQRTLLQTDLLFAKGRPSLALDHLDAAARRQPQHPQLDRARRQVLQNSPALQRTLEAAVQRDPADEYAQTSLLRMLVLRDDAQAVSAWQHQLQSAAVTGGLAEDETLRIIANVAADVAKLETNAGRHSVVPQLIIAAESAHRQLADIAPEYLPAYIGFIAEYRSAKDAALALQQAGTSVNPEIVAFTWLECLRRGRDRAAAQAMAQQGLLQLIQKHPASVSLRMAYAESLILFEQYDDALAVLEQLIRHDRRNAAAFSRAAWILAVSNRDVTRALNYSATASRVAPSDPQIRAERALVLLLGGDATTALQILSSIPRSERLATSWLYEAKALQSAGQPDAADRLVEELIQLGAESSLAPADARMLRALRKT